MPSLVLLVLAIWSAGIASAGEMASHVTTVAGAHQNAFLHEGFATPLTVLVRGANGNPISNARVGFAGPASGPGCDFGGAATSILATTDANGLARANCVAAKGWGEFSVAANVEGSADTATFDLRIRQGESGLAIGLGPPTLYFALAITPTVLTVSSVSALPNSTTSLSARLTRSGSALSFATIAFTVNSTSVGSATADISGTATLAGVSLVGIAVGTYPTGVGASYAGDFVNLASSGTASLTITGPTVPGAPTIGTATLGNASASVTFTAPGSNGGSTITSYTVTSNPGSFTGTGSSSPITIPGLTNGTPYTFTVTATNTVGTGAASGASNSVTPATVPGAPTIGTATLGNASASVTFTAPGSNGGSTITSYVVTSNPGNFTGTGSASPITVSGLSNGTPYSFTVTATNSIGTGSASVTSNSVTPVTVPGAPAIGTATPENASASVTFTAPGSNGGLTITSYTVTSNPGNFTGTSSASPITVSGLSNGTPYTFTVTATNGVGTGSASGASNSVTPAMVPGAPTIGTATFGNASASVTFTAPGSNGGSTITSYTVTSTPGNFTGTGSTSPITVNGLTNGTLYSFTVTATNSIGTGSASGTSNSVTPITVPGAPAIGTAAPENASASVMFTAPGSNGGSTITSYTVTSNPGNFTGTGSASPITVTGLSNGTPYSFTITATNSAGTGAASGASNSVTPAMVPGAPTFCHQLGLAFFCLQAPATSENASASVAFYAPGNNGGSAITSYTVTSNPGNFTGTGSSSPITVTGLANGTAYTFTVTATNAVGTGSASGASNSVTPVTVPGAPTIGTATRGNVSASVTFIAPGSNGGAAITSYTVTSNPGNFTGTGSASPITVSGLSNGTPYSFTMTATNAVGTGAASAASNSVIPAMVPGAPTIGTATLGNASAFVAFTAPESNGGSTITSYTVTSNPGSFTGTGSASPITVSGLTNGTAYTFTVTATNAAGTGSASGVSNSVTPVTVPGAPAIGTAAAGNASASIAFTAPGSNGGSTITSYTVTSNPGNFTGTGSASPITVSGLSNGTAYTFTVTATNAIGRGSASAASNSVSAGTLPGAPTIGSATPGNASAAVSFTPSVSTGGLPIISYTVTSSPGGFTGTGSSSPITVNGLNNGTAYTFTVTATNIDGTGSASSSSNSVTAATVPGAPTVGNVTATNGSASVPFTPPASNGGSAVTSYTVTAHPGSITATGSSSPITVGLTNGVAYTFTVTATNIAGTGTASGSSNSVALVGLPDPPTGVSAAAGYGSAIVSFIAPLNNGGASIIIYTVTSNPGSSTATGSSSPITVVGLINGAAYTFSVTATNRVGSGDSSASSNAVTPTAQVTLPGAPSMGSATPGNSGATVNFTAPANNGGAPISNYTVTSAPGGLSGTGSSSPITVTGLTNGTAYTFTVSATNSAGTGTASTASNSVTPNTGVPGAPQQVQATPGNSQATVSFTPPASSSNSAITSYTVTANPGGATATGSSSPITVTGLNNGTAYTFTVTATNGSGTGPAANPSNTVTLPMLLSLGSQSSFPRGVVGAQYPLQILAATGGTAPYTFAVTSGNLPDGLTFSAPQLSGTPDQAGNFSFTITVTDASGSSASSVMSISILSAQAVLIISESTAGFSLTAGSGATPTPTSITIRSSVVQQLLQYSVTVSPAVQWLDVNAGLTTPGSLTLALDQSALALPVGTNSTSVIVTCIAPSPCAGNAQTIAVTLSINAPAPQLSLTTGLVSFSTGGASTAAQSETVGVQNVGGGSITVTSASAADSWLSVSNLPATLVSGPAVPMTITANPAGLAPGYYRSTVTINSSAGSDTLAVTLLISSTVTITLGPSGTQYSLPAGGVLGSGTGTFEVTVTGGASAAYNTTVLPGAQWLAVTSGTGTAAPAAPGSVGYSLDAATVASLAPGTYYGSIRVVSTDAVDSPQDFLLALNVTATSQSVAPVLSTAGLLFISGSAATPQTVQVFASSASPLNYQASAAADDGKTWLSVSPSTGAASAGSPGTSMISINSTGLAPGVYRGGVSYAFSSASVRTVNITLIIPPAASAGSSWSSPANSVPLAASTCSAANLVGTQTGLVNNFASPAGLPVPLLVYLVDDCGTFVSNAQVVAMFSNGDPLLQLTPVSTIAGLYTATWTPRDVFAQVTVTSSASIAGLPTGSNIVTGQVTPSQFPILGSGFTNAFNPLVGGALAPGAIVQIYGTNLASSTVQAEAAPIPVTLGGTSVTIGGIAAPLFYVSPGQINAQVPSELQPGFEYQISISAAGGISTPNSVQIAAVSPGVAALASGAAIATHADGSLITTAFPANPGEVVILYLVGLGATDVPVAGGAASPVEPLAQVQVAPTLTVNGASAVVFFAGLTPGSVGLYQINFQVPTGAPNGDLPLDVSQGGVSANPVSLAVHN